MLLKPSKKLPALRLYAQGQLLYDGLLKDLPLKECVILEKSIQFFDDPEPCLIHRSAVRVRLTAEIEKEFDASDGSSIPNSLLAYSDFDTLDSAVLMK